MGIHQSPPSDECLPNIHSAALEGSEGQIESQHNYAFCRFDGLTWDKAAVSSGWLAGLAVLPFSLPALCLN